MFENVPLDPNKIHLHEFRILQGQVNSPLEFKPNSIVGYKSDVGFEMAFNLDSGVIKSNIQIKVCTDSGGKNKVESDGFFQIVFFFRIEDLESMAKEISKDELEVHPGLANAISSISYSTARGILLTRFQGTALREFILPVIDPNSLLKK
jgi:hypothetical protein